MEGKEWTVKIENVTAEDMSKFVEKAGQAGLSVGKLLGHFVNDLVCGEHSNGSDERMYAGQWFDRCGFSYLDNSFLKYLLGWERLEEAWRLWGQIEYCKEDIAKIKTALECGYMENKGQRYTWEDITDGSGKPCYSSREEWEKIERGFLEENQEDMERCRELLGEYWTEYKEFSKSDGEFEDEMKLVVEWVLENREYLDLDL